MDPAARARAAVSEYQAAKQAAAKAKEKGDKQKQAAAGRLIRELKDELTALGLSLFVTILLYLKSAFL